MIASAPTAKDAREILDMMRLVGNVSEEEYKNGRELIKKEFKTE